MTGITRGTVTKRNRLDVGRIALHRVILVIAVIRQVGVSGCSYRGSRSTLSGLWLIASRSGLFRHISKYHYAASQRQRTFIPFCLYPSVPVETLIPCTFCLTASLLRLPTLFLWRYIIGGMGPAEGGGPIPGTSNTGGIFPSRRFLIKSRCWSLICRAYRNYGKQSVSMCTLSPTVPRKLTDSRVALSADCIGNPDTTGLTLANPEGRLACTPSTSTMDTDLAEGGCADPLPVPDAGTLVRGGGLFSTFLFWSMAAAEIVGAAPVGGTLVLLGNGAASTSAMTTSSALVEASAVGCSC